MIRTLVRRAEEKVVPLFINGSFVESKTKEYIDIVSPSDNSKVVARVPQATEEELQDAVLAASKAFTTWGPGTPITTRQRVMFKFQALLREEKNMELLVESIVRENGKTKADAQGDIIRGLEVVEQACSLSAYMLGDTLENLASSSAGVDTMTIRQPLGVTASICPFNFPVMIPLWTLPVALTTGNTVVLKPSERTPTAALHLARLLSEAGLPDGVLNIVHGAHKTVDFIIDDPDIRAISFVGSNQAGEYIHDRAVTLGKRVQANMGAQNHATVMPDCDKIAMVNGLVGAAFGAAGQRCMALSRAIFVGEASSFIDDVAEKAQGLIVGNGADESADLGPVISKESFARIHNIIERAEQDSGVEVLLDGRDCTVEGFPQGNFIGPTILKVDFDRAREIECYNEEIFGPVLLVVEAASLDDAIAMTNACEFGNGACIFTTSGGAARKYTHRVDAGQVGVNVPVPVPLPMFSWTGSRGSFRGSHHFYGKDGVSFYTQIKTVTSSWPEDLAESGGKAHVTMPILGTK
eukprot:g2884.t1